MAAQGPRAKKRIGGGTVVVIGGANIDVKTRIAGTTVPATSNPGTLATLSAGGWGATSRTT